MIPEGDHFMQKRSDLECCEVCDFIVDGDEDPMTCRCAQSRLR